MKLKLKLKALLCLAVASVVCGMGQGVFAIARPNDEISAEQRRGVRRERDDVELRQQLLNRRLDFAIIQNDYRLVDELIDQGADVNGVGINGYTPLVTAVEHWRDSSNIIELLLNRGANPNQRLHIGGYMPGTTAYRIFQDKVFDGRRAAPMMARYYGPFPEQLANQLEQSFLAHNAE